VTILLGSLDAAMRGVDVARTRDFEAFVAAHRDRAVGLAWRLVGGDMAAAEDVAQEAFLRAHRGLDQFREEAKMSTWFYRILVNEAQRHLRWRWVRERVAGEMPDEPLVLRRAAILRYASVWRAPSATCRAASARRSRWCTSKASPSVRPPTSPVARSARSSRICIVHSKSFAKRSQTSIQNPA